MVSKKIEATANREHLLFDSAIRSFLHISVMVSMAISQPIYDILAKHPEFFVAQKAEKIEIYLLVFFLSGLLPCVLWLGWVASRWLSYRVSTYVLTSIISVLAGGLALQVFEAVPYFGGHVQLFLGLATAIGCWFLYIRIQAIGSLLSLLAPAIILFPLIFLLFSPITKVLTQSSSEVPGSAIESRVPVIFVVFDELPTTTLMTQNGEIDEEIFPAFADLAKHSTWFRNATTVASGTLNSLPALLTGTHPSHTKIPSFTDYPQNLFSMLGHSYELQVVESVTQLCSPQLCGKAGRNFSISTIVALFKDVTLVYLHLLLPEPYKEKLPTISENWSNFSQDSDAEKLISISKEGKPGWRIVQEIEEKSAARIIKASWQDWQSSYQLSLNQIGIGKEAFLHFQHIQLPHVPWRYLPSGKQYRDTFVYGKEKNDKWISTQPWLMAQGFQRHLLQAAYVDTLLADLLKRLRDSDIFDASLIVITSDHGASFQMGSKRRTPEQGNLADLAGVPLFVKTPYQKQGGVSEKYVRTIDILPTVAHLLGLDAPWRMDGHNIFSEDYPEQTKINVASTYGEENWMKVNGLESRNWILDWKSELFGPTESVESLFAMGPGRQFQNLRVEDLHILEGGQLLGELQNPEQFLDVDTTSNYSPSRVSGLIKAVDGTKKQIPISGVVLVSINGTIRGSGELFSEGEEVGKFAVMVPEDSFEIGRNRIELLYFSDGRKIESTAQEVELTPVEIE